MRCGCLPSEAPAWAKTVTVGVPLPGGIAQRVAQGIEHFDPHARFWLDTDNAENVGIPDPQDGHVSQIDFGCLTCSHDSAAYKYRLFVLWSPSHKAAVSGAIADVKLEGPPDISPSYPIYVAGQANLTGPAPEPIIRAFALAVGKPVVTYVHSS